MNIENMNLQEIEERKTAIESEIATRSGEDLEALKAEVKALNERKAELLAIEERQVMAQQIEAGEIKPEIKEERMENKKMTIAEYRNSAEYVNAYAEYIKTGKDEEVRSLLTTNVESTGTIAIPDFVYDEVKTAWENEQIMSRVNKVQIAGNLKVQFEISASAATVHTEGSGAVSEEELVEGIVTIVPANIKKWISVSDEVMSLRGQAFLSYIYKELTHKIVKKMADLLVGKIAALSTSASATAVCAAQVSSAPAMDTVAKAIAALSDEASNPVIIMNKLTWAAFKTAQYGNGYGADPFEGLPVLFNNTLPAYSSANANAVYMIVGDLGQGAIANFPDGDGIVFKFDDMSRKKEDLVEVLGREYVGVEPVACNAFTNVKKPSQG